MTSNKNKSSLVGQYIWMRNGMYGDVLADISPGYIKVYFRYIDGQWKGDAVVPVRDLVGGRIFKSYEELMAYVNGGAQ